MGVDMMELDLKKTKDGVLVLMHDGTLDRTTTGHGKVSDYTYEELMKFNLKRGHGIDIPGLKIPTLRQALEVCKDRITVNVDQGYDYYDAVLAITEKLGVTDQILIKGKKPIEVVAAHEAAYEHNMMYMPIVDIQREKGKALLDSYMEQGVVPLAYEVCWGNNNDNAFDEACKRIIAQGSKVWVNTIWASLCGGDGNDDDAAFQAKDPGEVYQQYLDKGVSMIQTDRPELLIGWLKSKGRHTL
jgi:glycerophosphoryl diester phosphodiesterase